MNEQQLHVVISGLVQGVGFRHATYRQALKLGLRGWVRNLPDGRVEAVIQGERATIEQLHAWCQHGPAIARVDRVETTWEAVRTPYTSFDIAF
jgi:acylphosphatase